MNPETKTPTNTSETVDNISQAKLQSRVSYFAGISIASEQYAILEWSADNRIRLFAIDGQTNQATGTIFDVAPNDIESVGGSLSMMTFKIAGKKYRVELSTASRFALGAGTVGLGVSMATTKTSGVYQWHEALRANNVTVRYLGFGKMFVFALIVVGIIAAVIITVYIASGEYQADIS